MSYMFFNCSTLIEVNLTGFKTSKVTNAVVRNWWERTYNSMGDREKAEIIPYFSSKFVSFNTNRLIRNIIWR